MAAFLAQNGEKVKNFTPTQWQDSMPHYVAWLAQKIGEYVMTTNTDEEIEGHIYELCRYTIRLAEAATIDDF